MIQQNKPKRPTNTNRSKPKRKTETQQLHRYTAQHIPRVESTTTADAGIRRRRHCLNRLELAAGATTVPPEFQVYQLHPKQRSTLNQTNITTGITGTRPTDAETTSNDNIRGIGYSVIFQGPDLQRASIGAAEISSEFSHQPP
ncbi:hypothetical protein Bca52824_009620 [Brassica carinata]|uniref:Uncharacterized protein n=1 Tax=Brassica carinata TaxID=52824 RepID=A0A8X8BAF7_BRACI|nr:hypothetical protein Bca52824_009620 [Brassica carinata]